MMTISRRTALSLAMAGLAAPAMPQQSHAQATPQGKTNAMKVKDVFILFCTPKMIECRDFYVEKFGFEVTFKSKIYIQLQVPAETGAGFSLAFMPPDHPFGEVYRDVYSGKGAFLTIEVADAKDRHDRIVSKGVEPVYALKDEDWGQRHFSVKDPHGTIVDVVQSIDPAPGYYDKYQLD